MNIAKHLERLTVSDGKGFDLASMPCSLDIDKEERPALEEILAVNKEYLQHDYYTDIITFDYTEGNRIGGDIFISLDTVQSNAQTFGSTYGEELYRILIHGVLHLCGINDKGPGEREIMTQKENEALALLPEGLKSTIKQLQRK